MEDNGKYIIDGEEIEIDYNEDVPLDKLNDLKRQTVSALDVFYIRRHLHHFAHWADTLTLDVDDRINKMEKEIETFIKNEVVCKGQTIPEIAKKTVHDIVNGNLIKINSKLDNLVIDGEKVHKRLDAFNTELLAQIKAVGDKTIYGSVINGFKKHFIRSSITAFIIASGIFAFFMEFFHINSFTDLFDKIWNFFR